jgi:predicted nucleic acid-binding protein
LIAPDTSLVVALFASWHEAHVGAREAVGRNARLPAHVLLESYSVLTRLPPPHRAPSDAVASFLQARFPLPLLTLTSEGHASLLDLARTKRVTGGAIYDALVAATVKEAGAKLLTRDRRAVRTYEIVGVDCEFLG